ncbi:DMT family transporter [Clostridium sediminicola]|uniref:DMT family transporter n=1 Tax=Clostridium sediminicola TaxID=3114879 RepID=UPI0031F1C76D
MDSKNILTKKINVIILAIICAVLWGSAFPTIKVSYIEVGIGNEDLVAKIVFAGLRFFIASIMIFLFTRFILKKSLKINKKYIKFLFLGGIIQTSLQYSFFYIGLSNIMGSKASILVSFEAFAVMLIAHFYYHNDKMNINKILGLLFGFTGIIVVNWGKGFNMNFTLFGEGFIMLSCVFGAIAAILAKELSKEINPFVITAWQMFIGSSIVLIFGVPRLSEGAITFTLKGYILLGYAAFLSATAFSIWYSLLKYNKAGEIAIYRFMIPISGMILSILFLQGEVFTINTLIALIFVSMGIIAINYTFVKKRRSIKKRRMLNETNFM